MAIPSEPVSFESGGERIGAHLYRPENVDIPPLVIMAHGLAALQSFRLPAFAERFVAAGWAVLTFDYRHFGESSGRERHVIRPQEQLEDWRAALAHARFRDDVDARRIVIWGTSFSGGHVLAIASEDTDLAGVISQVPGVGSGGDRRRINLWAARRILFHAVLDRVTTILFRRRHYIPVVGHPGEFAMLTTPESHDGYLAIVPGESDWQNRVAAGLMFDGREHQPTAHVERIACPALIIAGRDDSLIPASAVRAVADRIPRACYKELACNHFAPYVGEWFEKNVALQVAFLNEIAV